MIEFIQDYVTKALPPESFEDGQQVTRSEESELYFVRLGVAGFLVDGMLVDQDYLSIERKVVAIVATTDRRFADTGRGGEVIGLDAPQRATSGPGNAVVFAGQPESLGLSQVEADQLRGDLAQSVADFEGHRTIIGVEIGRLTGELDTANAATADAVAARERVVSDLAAANTRADGLDSDLTAARARIVELEQQVAAAAGSTDGGDIRPATKPQRGR